MAAFRDSDKRDVDGLLRGLESDDMADLFAFLLDPYDPAHLREALKAENGQQIASELIVLISGINDLRRVWESFSFSKPAAPESLDSAAPSSSPGIPGLLVVIDAVAQRYHIAPQAVLAWPYETFLTITELMAVHGEQNRKDRLRQILQSQGLSVEMADIPGLEFAPIPDQKVDH